jgi:hypothetical protein
MSYKSQMFPVSSTGKRPLAWRITPTWGQPPADLTETDSRDLGLLRSWLVCDSVIQTGTGRRINWNTVFGLALATAVSASIWAGIGLMIARIWK